VRRDTTARQESQIPCTTSPDDGPMKASEGSTLYASSEVESKGSTLHVSSVAESEGSTLHASSVAESRSSTLHALSVAESEGSTLHASSVAESRSSTLHASSGVESEGSTLHASSVEESTVSRVPRTPLQGSAYEYYNDRNDTKRSKPTALLLMDSSPDVSLSTMGSKFNPTTHLEFLVNKRILGKINGKQASLHETLNSSAPQLWMYFDSGASRSVIAPTSPIWEHLTQSRPVQGSCSVGDGTPLSYIEKGMYNNTIDTTVVKNLRYDLFSSVSAAKQGITSIIDYNMETGENNSYMVDKLTGNIIPLIERGQGILEVP
jgi:hypothetical protein